MALFVYILIVKTAVQIIICLSMKSFLSFNEKLTVVRRLYNKGPFTVNVWHKFKNLCSVTLTALGSSPVVICLGNICSCATIRIIVFRVSQTLSKTMFTGVELRDTTSVQCMTTGSRLMKHIFGKCGIWHLWN